MTKEAPALCLMDMFVQFKMEGWLEDDDSEKMRAGRHVVGRWVGGSQTLQSTKIFRLPSQYPALFQKIIIPQRKKRFNSSHSTEINK